jgi:hypothetical protein
MPVQDWADGQQLTAAAMNELVTSGYMRFADSAERDAFLVGDLAPVPGMTACMLDDHTTYTYMRIGSFTGWVPPPGTPCFTAYQMATQSLPSSAFVTISGFTADRNLNGWFNASTGRFNPKLPGIYEFTGGLSMAAASINAGTHRGGFRLNGAAGSTYLQAAEFRQLTTGNLPVSFSVRRFLFSMNGTTDYVELVAWANTTTTTGTGSQAPSFNAKYVGQ